jgi:para-nitrobenzyl esterase
MERVRRVARNGILAMAWVACGALVHAAPVITTTQGALSGRSADSVDSYLGIPYAQPPVGALRWRSPLPGAPWAGLRDAGQYGAICPQKDDFRQLTPVDEDCLTLNVFAPSAPVAAPRPILVWVHGGGFRTGGSPFYNGAFLARKLDAVVVTVNYRLGVLGFLATSGMTAEGPALNFGLQDQYEALRWVHRNAAAFGGDASRITLAGQSAGGSAVGCLALTSPKTQGLFARVISMSSYCSSVTDPLPKAQAAGDAIAAALGCPAGPSQMGCLRAKPVAQMLDSAGASSPANVTAGGDWHVAIDGETVPSAVLGALSKGRFHRVPVMIGTTHDEGRFFIGLLHATLQKEMTATEYEQTLQAVAGTAAPFVLATYPLSRYKSPDLAVSTLLTDNLFSCPTYTAAKYLSDRVPTFVYEFSDPDALTAYRDPYMSLGAYHAADLAYVFRTAEGEAQLNAAQLAMSEQMLVYWKRFVATGDPGPAPGEVPAVPKWPRFNRSFSQVQSFEPIGIRTLPLAGFSLGHHCPLWSTLLALQVVFSSP